MDTSTARSALMDGLDWFVLAVHLLAVAAHIVVCRLRRSSFRNLEEEKLRRTTVNVGGTRESIYRIAISLGETMKTN
jgi:hypothetical protein